MVRNLLISFVFALICPSLYGQNSIVFRAKSSKANEITISGGFVLRKLEVKSDNAILKVERQIVGLGVSYGIKDRFDLYGYGGYHLAAKLEKNSGEDGGFVVGAGVKLIAAKLKKVGFYLYTDFEFTSEAYDTDLTASYTVAHVGAIGRLRISEAMSAYAGVELFPFFSGKGEFDGINEGFEGRGLYAVVIGMSLPIHKVIFRPEASFLNGSSYSAALEMKL